MDGPYMTDSNDIFGERGGTRTLDPMIKSHVLASRNETASN